MANLSIIKKLMKEQNISATEMSNHLNITPQGFSKILRENSTKVETLESIADKLKVSPSIFFEKKIEIENESQISKRCKEVITDSDKQQISEEPIYLYDVSASAGFGSFDEMISVEKVIGKYVVPDFHNVDWMIHVKGSSMYPKYSSGDIIACRVLRESKFIQWGKVYVVATREQGILVKRLEEDSEDAVIAVSDNQAYKPFKIPKNEIVGIALVVGVIRME